MSTGPTVGSGVRPSDRPRPTDQADVRRHNAALVLGCVAENGPLSRARVAAHTGLTRATVGTIVDELLAGGLVAEQGTSSATGMGRPGTDLVLRPDGAASVGLEINVDGIVIAVVDLGGTVRHRASRSGDLRDRTAAAVLRSAARMVDDAVAGAYDLGLPVRGIGVAVPGLVDLGEQVLRLAPNLGWTDVPVVERLRSYAVTHWPCPVVLDNEANLAALGELWRGGHTSTDSFVLVNGDVGVGAGVVLDGRLHRGSRGFGGELGHLTVAPDGPECRCGARGCLEQVAGLDFILRQAGVRDAPRTGEDAVAPLLTRLRDGDERAVAAVRQAGRVARRRRRGAREPVRRRHRGARRHLRAAVPVARRAVADGRTTAGALRGVGAAHRPAVGPRARRRGDRCGVRPAARPARRPAHPSRRDRLANGPPNAEMPSCS